MRNLGYNDPRIIWSQDYSNLNQDGYWVVAAGIYGDEAGARGHLQTVINAGYRDAYVKYSGSPQGTPSGGTVEPTFDDYSYRGEPFWGIWVGAFSVAANAEQRLAEIKKEGYPDARMVRSYTYSNLNHAQNYYLVTAGIYSSEAAAKADIQAALDAGYKDAYVKHTGSLQ